MESSPVEPGEVLLGRYVVERVLGAGGMGVVVSAIHQTLGERVAIKFLLRSAAEPQIVERFLREARAAARLKSEHVARVTDVGTLEGGAPYMIMEFLEGNDAAVELQRRGALPVVEAIDYVLQACEGLAEAHSLGIIHRDVKPANLFLAARPGGLRTVKIIDFGIAKSIEAPSSLTLTSSVIGSPMYMPPEQIRNAKKVDPRSDVWALGVTCYELLSGKRPFEADSLHGTLASIIADEPKPLRSARPDAPAELEAALASCFEKDPSRRYASIAELARALAPFADARAPLHLQQIESVLGVPRSAPRDSATARPDAPPIAGAELAPAAEGLTEQGWTRAPSPFGRRARRALLAAMSGSVVVLALAFLFTSRAPLEREGTAGETSAHAVSSAAQTALVSAPAPPPLPTSAVAALSAEPPPSVSSAPRPAKAPRKRAPKSVASAAASPVVIEGRKF